MDDLELPYKKVWSFLESFKILTRIHWELFFLQLLLHVALVYGAFLMITAQVQLQTIFWGNFVFLFSGIGTGVGSHRFFSHRSFKATRGFKIFLIFCQTVSGEFSIHYWVKTHRTHHKFSDTDRDPTNIKRGFFFSYVGYYFLPRHPECQREWDRIDISDIEVDKDIMFQFRHYFILWMLLTIGIPTLVPYFIWNETLWIAAWMNLFRYGIDFSHLGLSNTISHYYGTRPYDQHVSARENTFMNIWTFGEGYHNFHHAFPMDYKGSEFEGWDYFNISTYFIHFFQKFGWIYDLKTTSPEMIAHRARRTGDGSHYSTSNKN